ncbi:deoxyribonuclease [Halothiobacillus diazotrophicus]|uniref:Deoxyribonuclease n=1 Tax=Halothiobacillus diazotrophicus TaxID=1860122 RepID=A0A191ZDN8_9GAMM|nr:TatD family hydrolase [Halothiobacillus diazotrophicus]ANJ65982.1 deoxyribonuclease [Halothiobacillus diazotrophicus]
MNLFDTHCHLDLLDLAPFDDSFDVFMAAAFEAGVRRMLCISIHPDRWPAMAERVAPYFTARADRPQVWLSYGVHPTEEAEYATDAEALVRFVQTSDYAEHILAIGETGLDYFRSGVAEAWQHERFSAHIAAARALDKPLIIHTRAAAADTMAMLASEGARDCGGVMHCFVEDWATAKQALDLGFYLSFSGILTYKNAADLRETARKAPQDRILVETDAPYLAPVPHRGKPNTPIFVVHTAQVLADVRGESLAAVADYTDANARRWLRLP